MKWYPHQTGFAHWLWGWSGLHCSGATAYRGATCSMCPVLTPCAACSTCCMQCTSWTSATEPACYTRSVLIWPTDWPSNFHLACGARWVWHLYLAQLEGAVVNGATEMVSFRFLALPSLKVNYSGRTIASQYIIHIFFADVYNPSAYDLGTWCTFLSVSFFVLLHFHCIKSSLSIYYERELVLSGREYNFVVWTKRPFCSCFFHWLVKWPWAVT